MFLKLRCEKLNTKKKILTWIYLKLPWLEFTQDRCSEVQVIYRETFIVGWKGRQWFYTTFVTRQDHVKVTCSRWTSLPTRKGCLLWKKKSIAITLICCYFLPLLNITLVTPMETREWWQMRVFPRSGGARVEPLNMLLPGLDILCAQMGMRPPLIRSQLKCHLPRESFPDHPI